MKVLLTTALLITAGNLPASAEPWQTYDNSVVICPSSNGYCSLSLSPPTIEVPLHDDKKFTLRLERGAKFCGSFSLRVGDQEVLSAKVSDPSMCSISKD